MAVYYKFKSAKDYDSIPIEGQFISVANLKAIIFESKQLGKGKDFDLMVSNAQTDEEYVDEAAMIPRNTSVLVRRIPGRPRKSIVTTHDELRVVEDKVVDLPPSSSTKMGDSSKMKYPEEPEWDEFGNDLYNIPDVALAPAQLSNPVLDIPPANKIDEDMKIKALINTPALDWNRQPQDGYGAGRGFGRGMGGRMMAGRGFGRGGLERRTEPPPGYICHRCKMPGHFIQHCSTNGDPKYDFKRMKPPTGIPRSMLMPTPEGSYALPSGAVAVLRPNEAAFEKEIEGLPSTRVVTDLPPELRCPLCKEVMKDAVLTGKCCFRSFCDKCIRDYMMTKSMCVCGATNILGDDIIPNRTLRETIDRILESTTSSAENAGSLIQVPDMESARPVQPKLPSPTLSAASKDDPKQPSKVHSVDMKEGEGATEGMEANIAEHSIDKMIVKNTDQSGATPESVSGKEQMSPESAPVPEDAQEKLLAGDQGKKKKKKKTRVPASDMQWRPFPDFGAENFSGMPLAPSPFNPYWAGGMPLGMDGYMTPFTGTMPYLGYTPGPFDVSFGGMLPQDPFAAQGYMMPGPPRDLSEYGMTSMGLNQGPPVMSREEFEARKADLRRKREVERLNEGEHSRDRSSRDPRSIGGSVADGPSMKAKPQRLMSQASVDRLERHARADRAEKPESAPSMDRRRSPTRRRSSGEVAAEGGGGTDSDAARKQKASVFSRICFPDPGEKKKRKSAESNGVVKESNGYRDRDREDQRKGSSSSGGRWGGGGYEHESSEEEEQHFKRRTSSSRREAAEKEEEGRGTRGSREREHGHDRPSVKRSR